MFSSKFITFATVAAASFAGLVQAAPHYNSNSNLNQVHYCNAIDFDASAYKCTSQPIVSNKCYNVAPGFADDVSSFAPYNARAKCTLYAKANCRSSSPKLRSVLGPSGISDLRSYTWSDGSNANDSLSSFKCTF